MLDTLRRWLATTEAARLQFDTLWMRLLKISGRARRTPLARCRGRFAALSYHSASNQRRLSWTRHTRCSTALTSPPR